MCSPWVRSHPTRAAHLLGCNDFQNQFSPRYHCDASFRDTCLWYCYLLNMLLRVLQCPATFRYDLGVLSLAVFFPDRYVIQLHRFVPRYAAFWTANLQSCFARLWEIVSDFDVLTTVLSLILPRSRTGTVWFYTSTSNKRAARPKLHTKSLTRDLKLMYTRLTLVWISINL